MGWRLRKSIRLGKFARINLSKSGIGGSVSIPGTGISYGVSPSRAKSPTEGPIVGCLSKVVMAFMLMFLAVAGLGLLASSFKPGPTVPQAPSASYPALPRPEPLPPSPTPVAIEAAPPTVQPEPEPPKLSLYDRVAPVPVPTDQTAKAKRAATIYQMGRNLEIAGNRKAALENYRRVLKDFADTDSAREAEARVRAMGEK